MKRVFFIVLAAVSCLCFSSCIFTPAPEATVVTNHSEFTVSFRFHKYDTETVYTLQPGESITKDFNNDNVRIDYCSYYRVDTVFSLKSSDIYTMYYDYYTITNNGNDYVTVWEENGGMTDSYNGSVQLGPGESTTVRVYGENPHILYTAGADVLIVKS